MFGGTFLIGCIGTRLALACVIALCSPTLLRAVSVVTAAMAIGFASIWLFGWRKTGPETGGRPIWWDSLRPLHALVFATVSVLSWRGRRTEAAAIVVADALVGLVATATFARPRGGG